MTILSYGIPAPVPGKAKESSALLEMTILTRPGNDKCKFAPLFEYYARNDNLVVWDSRACSEQSEGIFFAPRNDNFIG